jgi:hypothetical protein
LFLGGAIARAAESSSEAPTNVSISYTDANGRPLGTEGSSTTTVSESGKTPFGATQGVSETVNGATVNGANGTTGSTGNTGSSTNSVEQALVVSLRPGPLTITPATEAVSFTKVHGAGNGGPKVGSPSTVTVVDARGSLVGWQATVSLQSVNGFSAADLAKAKLCVSPDAPTVVAGNPPEVKAGRHQCGSAGEALTLFYAPPNGGGGTFSDTGALTLIVPGWNAGSATATLAIAVH